MDQLNIADEVPQLVEPWFGAATPVLIVEVVQRLL